MDPDNTLLYNEALSFKERIYSRWNQILSFKSIILWNKGQLFTAYKHSPSNAICLSAFVFFSFEVMLTNGDTRVTAKKTLEDALTEIKQGQEQREKKIKNLTDTTDTMIRKFRKKIRKYKKEIRELKSSQIVRIKSVVLLF